VEDPIERARLRFKSMLTSAEQAAQWAAEGRPGVLSPSSLMLVATKAMNRAGGFLEAISIVLPDVGAELLVEFESFASRVDRLSFATEADGDRRNAGSRRSGDDRRAGDRRLGHDRRHQWIEVPVERRRAVDRRAEPERRTGKIREVADRRWRAIQH
jgi:hypothetical protein